MKKGTQPGETKELIVEYLAKHGPTSAMKVAEWLGLSGTSNVLKAVDNDARLTRLGREPAPPGTRGIGPTIVGLAPHSGHHNGHKPAEPKPAKVRIDLLYMDDQELIVRCNGRTWIAKPAT